MIINTNKQILIFILIVIALGLCIYGNTLGIKAFHWDDKSAIQTNPFIQNSPDIGQIFKAFNTRFITGLSYAINVKLSGMNPFGFRLFNLALHLLNSLMVYCLVQVTLATPYTGKNAPSKHPDIIPAISGLLFLVHPAQTESLNLITQRFVLIAAFFYITSIWLYAAARIKGSKPLYGLSLITTVCAMFSKEISFTLPLAIILYEFLFFRHQDKPLRKRLLVLIPFLCTMLIIPLLLLKPSTTMTPTARIAKSSQTTTDQPGSFLNQINRITRTESEVSRRDYFLTQLNVLRTYTRLLLWPANQNLDYDYPVRSKFLEAPTVISALYLLFLILLAIALRNRSRLVSFGILWFFLTLSVESSVIPIGYVINEHRLYLPMFGFALIVSTVLTYFCRQKRTLFILIALIIASLSIATIRRNALWKDEVTLWEDTSRKSPMKGRPLANLGIAYKDRGEFGKAINCLSRSIELDPNSVVAYTHLAFCYRYSGDMVREAEWLQKAIALNPHYSLAYFGLGYSYYVQGARQEAIKYYEKALELDPQSNAIYKNLAVAYKENNEIDKIGNLIDIADTFGNKNMANQLRYLLAISSQQNKGK